MEAILSNPDGVAGTWTPVLREISQSDILDTNI